MLNVKIQSRRKTPKEWKAVVKNNYKFFEILQEKMRQNGDWRDWKKCTKKHYNRFPQMLLVLVSLNSRTTSILPPTVTQTISEGFLLKKLVWNLSALNATYISRKIRANSIVLPEIELFCQWELFSGRKKRKFCRKIQVSKCYFYWNFETTLKFRAAVPGNQNCQFKLISESEKFRTKTFFYREKHLI